MLILFFGVGWIATRLGQRKAMLFGTWGGLIFTTLSIVLFAVGDPTQLSFQGSPVSQAGTSLLWHSWHCIF